jgi:hypothetical protein
MNWIASSKEEVQMVKKTHEEMLNISSHKRTENQNQDSSSLLLEWLLSRTQAIANANEDEGKKEHSYTLGGNIN